MKFLERLSVPFMAILVFILFIFGFLIAWEIDILIWFFTGKGWLILDKISEINDSLMDKIENYTK